MASVPTQIPALHALFFVHVLLSSQDDPSGFAGAEHVPVTGLQASVTWQLHSTGLLPTQFPASQTS